MDNNILEKVSETVKTIGGEKLTDSNISRFENREFNSVASGAKTEILSMLGLSKPNVTSQEKINPTIITSYNDAPKVTRLTANIFTDEVKFHHWKLIYNISSKLLSFDDNSAILECLIDREERVYEERAYPINLFNGYSLLQGNLFKICIYERGNQMMIDVKNDPNLILESDFPSIDFYSEFKDLELSKKS